ncbi:MAG: type VI secretion system baseplate subunit TssK [Myxococcales bacterium]|nr:type VI secretion system baseplate subunit TssK [Myxococcales bacterium]
MNPRRPRWPLALRLMQHHMQWADTHREERLQGALGLLADHRFGLISGSLEDRSLESGTVSVRDLVVVFPSGLWAEAARLETPLPPFHDVDGEQTVFVAIRRDQPHVPAVSNDGKDHRFQRTFQTLGDSPDSAVATATPSSYCTSAPRSPTTSRASLSRASSAASAVRSTSSARRRRSSRSASRRCCATGSRTCSRASTTRTADSPPSSGAIRASPSASTSPTHRCSPSALSSGATGPASPR